MKYHRISNKGDNIEYDVVHRPGVTRRIHLELAEHGRLRVVAPRRMSKRVIQATMQEQAGSVSRFLAKARARQQDTPPLRYVSGERHLFMGQGYPLFIHQSAGKGSGVELVDGCIQIVSPNSDPDQIRLRLTKWYRQNARLHFSKRIAAFSKAAPWTAGGSPTMRLRLMKRAWGTCSAKGVITLNPHLLKAPPDCIDYVIAHEICHLKEHNHGKAFYALQEQLCPGWREAKDHLRNKGHVYLHV